MASRQQNNTKAFALFITASSKTRKFSKARSLGIKCVSFLGINMHSFSPGILYYSCNWKMEIACACCYEKTESKFSLEIWAPKAHTFVEKWYAYFFCSFQSGNEKFIEIRAGSLSCLEALVLDSTLMAMSLALGLQCQRARRLCNMFWRTPLMKCSGTVNGTGQQFKTKILPGLLMYNSFNAGNIVSPGG